MKTILKELEIEGNDILELTYQLKATMFGTTHKRDITICLKNKLRKEPGPSTG